MRVIIVHALRNAMLPVVTVIGLQVGPLLAGAILTDTIFAWPGLGRWLIDALQRRDYPVVQGGVLLVAPRCWKCWAKIISAPRVPKVLPGCG